MLHVRQPDGEEIEFDIERPLEEPMGVRPRAAPHPALRQPLRLLLRRRQPAGLRDVLYIRDDDYRLSLPLRQLRDADQPEAVGRRADHRVPAVAALRLGARHRPGGAALAAPQPDRARHHPAAARVRRPRHPVPHPDRDVARGQRRRGARADAPRPLRLRAAGAELSRSSRWGSRSSASTTWCASRPTAECRAAIDVVEARAADRPARARASPGRSAPTSSTCAPGSSCRPRRSTTASSRSRTASARCAGCSSRSPTRRESLRRVARAGAIGVVTGHRDGAADAAGARAADRRDGRGVRADPGREFALRRDGHHRRPAARRRPCATRSRAARDLDLALLPAESVNDDGLFLDSISRSRS